MSNRFTILRKISPKTCGVPRKKDLEALVEKDKKKNLPIMRVYGIIRSTTEKKTEIGTSHRLNGDIEAINMLTGEVFRSGFAYLPGIAEQQVCEMIWSAKDKDEKASVKFAIDLTISYHDSKYEDATKYVWGVESLIENDQADPLSDLRNLLPAPKAKK